VATFVEAPLEIQSSLKGKIPQDHLDTCSALDVPTAGNAAGNTANLLDLDGEPVPPNPIPAGFTARGIVALVFSIISGLLGVSVIIWYGLAGDESSPNARAAAAALAEKPHPHAARRIAEAGLVPPSPLAEDGRGEEISAVPGGGSGTRL
jgi:iron transport multicopper oxidase